MEVKNKKEREGDLMLNNFEIIKNLRKYNQPADFFYERLPEYASENGNFIKVRRAFQELLGCGVGIHADRYRDRIAGIHIMSLTNALRKLRDEGKVEMRSQGLWIWKGGENVSTK